MSQRIDYMRLAPAALTAWVTFARATKSTGLEPSLVELVKTRTSQINGCAYCVDMHTKDARVLGETEQRLYALSVWRDAPFYSERERAALAWTEAVTLVHDGHVPDEVYEAARRHFSEEELVNLTMVVIVINGWNRLAIGFRTPAGTYQPPSRSTAEAASR